MDEVKVDHLVWPDPDWLIVATGICALDIRGVVAKKSAPGEHLRTGQRDYSWHIVLIDEDKQKENHNRTVIHPFCSSEK